MPETESPAVATVRLNDDRLACPDGLTLAALLDGQCIDPNQVATALNGQFVSRAQRASTVLRPGDVVLTFQAIVGG